MKLALKDKPDNILTVSPSVFDYKFNSALIHQVLVAYNAGSRQGTRSQKNRTEIQGSGKKPWRQKGTGRARAGNIRSPLWRSGAVAFAAKNKDYSQKINKKMYRGALKSILSNLIKEERLIIISEIFIEIAKTKLLIQKLREILDFINIKSIKNSSILIVDDKLNNNLVLSARNLHNVQVCRYNQINPINLINSKKVIMTSNAIKKIEVMLK
ncbi:50S ribosomal protein L4 [Candidatus Schneideria nysicola]|uniref:50S ribosomal protein L4 n=1 Tax=Candidatus Schneideria nysicola TaxID=1081631 RepID=UPI001CAA499B|nr:50S ribosomal protein L4 [Candidatus Schneideria nysicola]UAJ65453.1 50S ribosomal protein L4 [Candidatus Schneideria nysicola]UAJ65982.1 50S ribosomal protein L4 [Candidatus Schneideria nysicola]